MDESVRRAHRSSSPFTDEQETRRPVGQKPQTESAGLLVLEHSSYRARRPPHTLAELKETVEVFAESLDEDEVIDAVRHVRTRAHACMRHRGGRFEGTLQDSCLMCSLYV